MAMIFVFFLAVGFGEGADRHAEVGNAGYVATE